MECFEERLSQFALRIEKNKFEAYKIKSVSFLERESSLLDKNVLDIESCN